MADKKMTQKEMFANAIAYMKGEPTKVTPEEFVQFFEERVEVLERKNENRKPTKTQEENEVLKSQIAEVLSTENGQTATEVLTALGDTALSNQKVSAMLRQMAESGTAKKVMDKKKALWFRA